MAKTHVLKHVTDPFPAFRDRSDAGVKLADFLGAATGEQALVLALPRGGVPVAARLADRLKAPLDITVVRKLPIPDRPEAGFGAVTVDGHRVLNEDMLKYLSLSDSVIDAITREVEREIRRRAKEYRVSDREHSVTGLEVYMVDDGLATGYTMIAAAGMIRDLEPRSLTLCVPVSPWDSVLRVEDLFDEVHILYVQEFPPFAVASFYEDFHDLTDNEVREILIKHQQTL
jgi:putative phosphoribosyl transferase